MSDIVDKLKLQAETYDSQAKEATQNFKHGKGLECSCMAKGVWKAISIIEEMRSRG